LLHNIRKTLLNAPDRIKVANWYDICVNFSIQIIALLNDTFEENMNNLTFRAMIVEETRDHQFVRNIKDKSISDLPDGDVLVRVSYSSLNYKDALSAIGNRGVTRKFPHTPGIDAAGTVEESRNKTFQNGDAVIVTSYDLGMNTPGSSASISEYLQTGSSPCPRA